MCDFGLACCRDNATEQLQSLQASQDEKQHILQILQRLQQHDNTDEAELDTASDTADDAELSEHILQKLSMAVCKCMKHVLSHHFYNSTA